MGNCYCNQAVKDFGLREEIHSGTVVLYIKKGCANSDRAQALLKAVNIKPRTIEIEDTKYQNLRFALKGFTGQKDPPYIFIGGKHFGGLYDLEVGIKQKTVQKLIKIAEERSAEY
ncbi:unnamed protein product [Blepharisma stoltei]|uniref:Glutaredoxin domain-containing protein n=1 Tax=Blepharisma stoltei TaxID=1481888 RepID=A0AAU9JPX0_9CILI|nr:unnamed protein product [Blepharisma stoltei]